MKAVTQRGFGPPSQVLRLQEVPDPVAGPGEVLVRVEATEPRGVVGFEDRVLGAHGPLVIAAASVSRSPRSSAMEVSEK